MSRTRKLIIAFWVFIICMLLWQFYTYNSGLTQQAIDHPRQEHFYFIHTNASSAVVAPKPVRREGADVQQTAFSTENDTPNKGSFTCHVTLKNEGNSKAVGVQVMVRPYRGATNFDEDVGQQKVIVLSDDDPISQFGDWLSFPDLAPGESSTQSTVFISRSDFKPGVNPKPNIIFQTEKSKSSSPPPRGAGG